MDRRLPALLLVLVLLAACSPQSTPAPTTAATPSPAVAVVDVPTATAVPLIATAAPSPTPPPPTLAPTHTATAQPPTSTPTAAPTSTPTPAPTQPPAPSASVKSATLNLRSGPGSNYDVAGAAKQGDTLAVTGQTEGCGWLKITTAEGRAGWVNGEASNVALNVPCASVPPAAVPPAPTAAPLPPTPTRPPTQAPAAPGPTPAPTSTPAGDQDGEADLPADQGCYLFENRLGPELTVTITAQQWKWNTTFEVTADGGQHLICLSPGHFTVTVDAPPPWGTLNDDLYVEAGEHYHFPIQAG